MKKISIEKVKSLHKFLYEDMRYVILLIIVACIFGIIATMIFYFYFTDNTPATEEDYAYFEDYLNEVEQNPNIILNFPFSYNLSQDSKGNTTIKANNSECAVTFNYDKNYKIISTKREDHCIKLYELIFVAFCFSFLILALLFIISFLIINMLKKTIKKAEKQPAENEDMLKSF